MAFRKIRGIGVSYGRQGQIYFSLANYRDMPRKTREAIDCLIREAAHQGNADGQAYELALRAWLIEQRPWQWVLDTYRVRGATLLEKRKWIYEHW